MEVNLTSLKDFSELKKEYYEQKISREQYWAEVKIYLTSLVRFTQSIKDFAEMHVINGELIFDIKPSKNSKNRILMVLIEDDVRSVPFAIISHGFYEPFQADILIEIGNKSETFVDIGANTGFYSLALCENNQNLNAYSFEPNPKVYNVLNYNIDLNKSISRIRTYCYGLHHNNEILTMFEPKISGTGAGSLRKLHRNEDTIEFSVEVKKLDDFKLEKIDLIKMDVEGNEFNVLTGALETIISSRPTVCAELLRKWMKPFGHEPQNFVDELLNLDYKCFAISEKNLREITKITESTIETNFIFCHESKKEHVNYLRSLVV